MAMEYYGIYVILITQTLDALATMVVLPTMPFYAMHLGADALVVSLLGSAYNLAQVFCSPALGALSDRVGRKKVMVMGLTGQAVCNGLMSQAFDLPTLMIARMLGGMAMSTGPVEMAYIMDFVDTEAELSRVLSLQRIMTSAGAFTGPIVARCFSSYSFCTLCRGLVIVNVLNLVIGACFWKDRTMTAASMPVPLPKGGAAEPQSPAAGFMAASSEVGRESFLGPMWRIASGGCTGVLLLASSVYTFGYGISDGPEVVFLKEHFAFGKKETCDFFVLANLSSLLCSMVVPFLIDSFGAVAVCFGGCIGASVSVLSLVVLMGVTWVPYIYAAAMVGLFGTMFGLGFLHLVQQFCPRALLGTMLGLQSACCSLANTVAPPLGGLLYCWSNAMPCFVTSLLAALGATACGALPRGPPPEVAKPEALDEAIGEREPETEPEEWEREPLIRREPAVPRLGLRRNSSFGLPIFPSKNFSNQFLLNRLSLDLDPELRCLYRAYRGLIHKDKEKGVSSTDASVEASRLLHVATVPGDMVAAEALRSAEQGRTRLQSDMLRPASSGDMA